MADLVVSFNGMVLIGYGTRGEAWLVDTSRVSIGHTHRHSLVVGSDIIGPLNGELVTFEDRGEKLGGPLNFEDDQRGQMVDLDELLRPSRSLTSELLTSQPDRSAEWRNLLAAWIRLPGGRVDVRAEPFEKWRFKTQSRQLTEEVTITVQDVDRPSVRIEQSDGSSTSIPIPKEHGLYRVFVNTVFVGVPESRPKINQEFALDEVLLLYSCLTTRRPTAAGPAPGGTTDPGMLAQAFGGNVPKKRFTKRDADRLRLAQPFSWDPLVCPSGIKELPAA